MNKKIYSQRFSTDCFSDYFNELAKGTHIGMNDYIVIYPLNSFDLSLIGRQAFSTSSNTLMNGLLFFEIHGQSKLPSDKYPKPDNFLSDLLLTLLSGKNGHTKNSLKLSN